MYTTEPLSRVCGVDWKRLYNTTCNSSVGQTLLFTDAKLHINNPKMPPPSTKNHYSLIYLAFINQLVQVARVTNLLGSITN